MVTDKGRDESAHAASLLSERRTKGRSLRFFPLYCGLAFSSLSYCAYRPAADGNRIPMSRLALILSLSACGLFPSTYAQSWTIADLPGFQAARSCIQRCVNWSGWEGGYPIPSVVDCPVNEQCVCQTYLRDDATTWISQCIYKTWHCSSEDYSQAIQFYNYFCGWATPTSTSMPVSSTSYSRPVSQDVVIVTESVHSPPTVTDTSSQSSSGISPTNKISESLVTALTAALLCIGALTVISL